VTVKRKKSLPDCVTLPKTTTGMAREEIAALGSARRQEVRRQQDEAEKYRANPFLYLLNPNIKVSENQKRLFIFPERESR
jgi:junctophilin